MWLCGGVTSSAKSPWCQRHSHREVVRLGGPPAIRGGLLKEARRGGTLAPHTKVIHHGAAVPH